MAGDSFPRQLARTRRFTCGRPRSTTVSPDGRRVVFLRSRGGDDPVLLLHVLDVPVDGEPGAPAERVVLDPATVGADGPVPPEEAARRERARELGGGVVRYAADREVRRAVTTLGGRSSSSTWTSTTRRRGCSTSRPARWTRGCRRTAGAAPSWWTARCG